MAFIELRPEVESKLWGLQRERQRLHAALLAISGDIRALREELNNAKFDLQRLEESPLRKTENMQSRIEAKQREITRIEQRMMRLQRDEPEAQARWRPMAQLVTACERYFGVGGR